MPSATDEHGHCSVCAASDGSRAAAALTVHGQQPHRRCLIRRAALIGSYWSRPTLGAMDSCIFCEIVRGDAPSWRIYEDESTYAFLNVFPATEWHALVVPKVHHVDVFDTPVEDLVAVTRAVKRVVDLYQRVLGISNVQIINSSGAQAQQDVFHVHFHIVPRQRGDGQDVQWSMHPEWRGRFDDMVSKLRDAGAVEAGSRGKDADLTGLLRGVPY